VLTLIVFGVLPWGITELALLTFTDTVKARQIEHLKISQERLLAQVSLLDDETVFASRLINRVFTRLQKHGVEEGRREVARLERLFPHTFELIFFDGSGNLLPEVSSLRRGRTFLERCYTAIGAIFRGEAAEPGQSALLRELFKMPRIESLRQYGQGKPMPIGEDPRAGYCSFHWAKPASSSSFVGASGYLAFYNPDTFAPNTALLHTIAAAEKRIRAMRFGAIDLSRRTPVLTPSSLGSQPSLASALLKASTGYQRTWLDERFLITLVPRKRHGSLFCVQEVPTPLSRTFIRGIRLLLLMWSLFLLHQVFSGRFLVGSRITLRIVSLFLFSVGLPTALLLVGGYRALEDHRHVLLDSLERTMRTRLRQFDEQFPSMIAEIEDRLQKLKREAESHADRTQRINTFTKLKNVRSITDFLLVDGHGRSLWDLREPENAAVAQRYQVGRLMAREIMKRLNGVDQIDVGTLVTESVNSTMSSLADAGSWELFQRNLGRFTPFGLANEGCFMLFDAVRGKSGQVEQMLCSVMFRAQVESRFFRDHRRALERQTDLNWRVSLWSRTRLMRSIYSEKRSRGDVDEIGLQVHSQQSSIRKIIHTRKGAELIIGQLGQNLQSFVLVASAPLAPLEKQIALLWQWTAALASLLVLATFVIGRLLSEQLLRPIGSINEGIQAIRERDFQHQVPVHTRDELGDVSALMNHVLEEMRDLSIARAIQETLFPPGEIRMNRLIVYGQSRTLSDVGGDYVDYVQLDDHRLFGLVGDVSGHGVSAALIMGMAKCFFTIADRHQTPLPELLAGFNRYLYQTIKRKKMMTMILFRWNGETRTLEFANGGHVSPFLQRASTGVVEELAMPCMPLGVRLNATFASREVVLETNDAVMLCTDGLAEAKNPAGEDVGYQTPPVWFGELGGQEPKAMVESLFTRLDSFRGEAPVNDDVTIICLRVLPSPSPTR